MKKYNLFIFANLITLMMHSQNKLPTPPVAERIPFEIKNDHGGTRVDYYYWMKDRENKKVIEYLKSENTYLNDVFGYTKPLQEKLFSEMKDRIKEDENSVPYKKGNYYYYVRYVAGGEYPIYCRKKETLQADEEILLDGNAFSKGTDYLSFYLEISPDETKACVISDVKGRNFYSIKIKDLKTGAWLSDEIADTRNGCEWTADNKSILYCLPDQETLRVYQLKKHIIGTKTKDDVLLFQEDDETLDLYLSKSRSEQYMLLYAGRTDANKYLYADALNPEKFIETQPLQTDLTYYVDHTEGNRFTILTNYNAKNYKLVETKIATPQKENWIDIIAHRNDVFINSVSYFKNFTVIEETQEGLVKLRIRMNDKTDTYIQFDEPAYFAGMGTNPNYNTDEIRYSYSSLTTPFTIYDYNIKTQVRKLMKEYEVPTYDKSNYTTERIMVTSRDGKKIPMSIVYHKTKYQKDGNHPGFQYAYGSYGSSTEAYFDANVISLLDRGFVYVIAHVRGGQEMGGAWYDDGKMLNKINTFNDFIDCSEWLIKNKYVAKEKLFANGGSAGGLLMGAITNMRPDLYKGIIADVPFVDVMTTMEDETIPLTSFEWLEWGNPAIKEQYDYMLSYSPYDNVEKKAYPNLLVTTGLNDSQVQYFEPAKWVAKLRFMKTDSNLLLFKINMDAGHGGNSGRYESLKEYALGYAFMIELAGIKN